MASLMDERLKTLTDLTYAAIDTTELLTLKYCLSMFKELDRDLVIKFLEREIALKEAENG